MEKYGTALLLTGLVASLTVVDGYSTRFIANNIHQKCGINRCLASNSARSLHSCCGSFSPVETHLRKRPREHVGTVPKWVMWATNHDDESNTDKSDESKDGMDESEAKGEVEASSEDEKGRNALQKLFFAAANKFLEQEEEKAAAQEVQGGDEQAVEIHQFLQGGLGDEQQEEGGGGGGEEQEDQVTVWEEEEEAYVVGVDSDVVGGTGYGLGEGSVALSYRSDNGTRDAEFYFSGEMKDKINPYVDVITRLSPGELIGRFVRSAPPRVQDAVTQTVAGLLGSMGPPAFQTSTVTTSMALANMMFQLQMTGYMFRNAEYRLSLAQSIRGSAGLLPGEAIEEAGKNVPALPQIQGTIKLITENGQEIEVDANAYMGELRQEVETLRAELAKIEEAKELETEENLLNYVKNMPEEQMQQLTSNMSPEVLDAMSQLVEIVSNTMGTSMVGANTLTHQTGSAMAQLCLWQLVIGYNLREVEAREELQKKFEASK